MKRGLDVSFVGILCIAVSACGGDKIPTAPSPPPPPTITIAGSSTLRNGRAETFTANVSGCVWGGDAPQIATISQAGLVTPIALGAITIWCDAQGARGTKLLKVIPDFQGTWLGDYSITGCQQTGWAADIKACTDTFTNGRVLPATLNLTQDGDRVSGTFALGTVTGDAQGPIDADAGLVLTGTATFSVQTYVVTWRLRSDQVARATGSLHASVASSTATGSLVLDGVIRTMNR